ncbi:hypothetical protein OG418_49105 [Streptomyces phaeochromogenes]|uniref:hypothetical protein n=1 Tax=Streptomyces phaeochromogenes TaxID=1923 RepID=UPI00324CDCBA
MAQDGIEWRQVVLLGSRDVTCARSIVDATPHHDLGGGCCWPGRGGVSLEQREGPA